jgi:nucleoside phosphorylase
LKVLVTFALDHEFGPWRRMRGFRRMVQGSHPCYEARVGASQVRVLLTGVGCKTAGDAIRAGFRWSPDVVISSGFAGALRPVYGRGAILAARRVFDERLDPRFAPESDRSLLRSASEQGAAPVEAFYTRDTICLTAHDKRLLSPRADAVEMESCIIMSCAQRELVPAIALRAISDTSDEDLPFDFNKVLTGGGQVSISRVLGQVALGPRSLRALVRLSTQSRVVAESLGRFLDTYVGRLALEQPEGRRPGLGLPVDRGTRFGNRLNHREQRAIGGSNGHEVRGG